MKVSEQVHDAVLSGAEILVQDTDPASAEPMGPVLVLLRSHGLQAVLEALRDASDVARDITRGEPGAIVTTEAQRALDKVSGYLNLAVHSLG